MVNLKTKALEYFAAKPHDDEKARIYLTKVYKEDMIRLGFGLNIIYSILLGAIVYCYQLFLS